MNCCECQKEIDTSKTEIPPKWFGGYRVDTVVAVICAECLSDPKKRARWENGGWMKAGKDG